MGKIYVVCALHDRMLVLTLISGCETLVFLGAEK